jgi:hypothetical protein
MPRKIEQKVDPSVDTNTEPLRQVNEMAALKYFKYGAELMKQHPPHATDWSINARMKRIGLEPAKSFDGRRVSADVLARGAAAGLKLMREKLPTLVRVTNGWQMNTDTMGVYGNYYLKRAIVAMIGLGANQPEDAIYPLNVGDAAGRPVAGEQLPAAFQQGRAASGRRVLVADHVRRRRLPDRQSAQRLRHRRPGRAQVQCRRFARHLHSKPKPRPGQGIELAPGAEEG